LAKEDKAKVKMTVIHFETESDNATLQENIRAIAHTLTRALATPQRVVYALPQLPGGNSTDTEIAPEVGEQDVIDAEEVPPSSAPKPKGGSRQYRTPQPLDIDLTSGDVPLKAFLEQKKPDGDVKRYLAIAYWLKKYRDINEVTMDHAYTCYRHMGWQVPKEAGQPFRTMKTKSYGWVKSGTASTTLSVSVMGIQTLNLPCRERAGIGLFFKRFHPIGQ
jgi:hypothetical protein